MRKLALSAVLFLAFSANFSAQDVAVPKAPIVTESEALKIQLAATRQQLVLSRFAEAKANFDKLQAAAQAEYDKLGRELDALVEKAYKDANVDRKDFDLDPATGQFVAKSDSKK